MDIKVEVGPIDLNTVIGEHRIYDDEEDGYRTEPVTIGQAVAKQVFADLKRDTHYGALQREVLSLRTEEIRAQLEPIVRAAIDQPMRKTNTYGEPTGEPTTLRALIVAEVEALLKRPADQYSREKGTWLQALIREQVDKALRAELAEVLKEEKEKVVAAVRGKAAELIAEAVKAGIGR